MLAFPILFLVTVCKTYQLNVMDALKVSQSTCARSHARCGDTNLKEFKELQDSGSHWICQNCKPPVIIHKPAKCLSCKRTIPKHKKIICCSTCSKFSHQKCSVEKFHTLSSWTCDNCFNDYLPFPKLTKEQQRLNMEGKDIPYGDHISLSPSFTVQTLIDRMPGDTCDHSDTYLSDSISSKCYTASAFLAAKLPKDILV